MKIHGTAIYVLWRREMIRFVRAKSRIIGSLAMPVFFLTFLGLGFRRMPVPGMGGGSGYIGFLAPGIIGMTLLFSSSMQGMSVLWDREFGFLKEIMVAPVSRVSLVLGRIAGGTTTSMLQGILIFGASLLLGFRFRGPARGDSAEVARGPGSQEASGGDGDGRQARRGGGEDHHREEEEDEPAVERIAPGGGGQHGDDERSAEQERYSPALAPEEPRPA